MHCFIDVRDRENGSKRDGRPVEREKIVEEWVMCQHFAICGE